MLVTRGVKCLPKSINWNTQNELSQLLSILKKLKLYIVNSVTMENCGGFTRISVSWTSFHSLSTASLSNTFLHEHAPLPLTNVYCSSRALLEYPALKLSFCLSNALALITPTWSKKLANHTLKPRIGIFLSTFLEGQSNVSSIELCMLFLNWCSHVMVRWPGPLQQCSCPSN